MPKVTVVDRSGAETALDIRPGVTLMQTITDAGITDLLALCGGVCSCCTCHVFVENGAASLPDVSVDEDALLDGSAHRAPNSRLSCQIRLSDDMDGLRVSIAPED
jgi:2Fe-2S ferredoxin